MKAASTQVLEYDARPELLDELAAGYSRVTGRTNVSVGQRRFLAACYRTHGDDTEALLRVLFAEGGEVDLLLRLREHAPRLRPDLHVVSDATDLPDDPKLQNESGGWLDTPQGRAARANWGALKGL